eukprot:scaffold1084_cov114-Isochrysis_galbana.AAC.1
MPSTAASSRRTACSAMAEGKPTVSRHCRAGPAEPPTRGRLPAASGAPSSSRSVSPRRLGRPSTPLALGRTGEAMPSCRSPWPSPFQPILSSSRWPYESAGRGVSATAAAAWLSRRRCFLRAVFERGPSPPTSAPPGPPSLPSSLPSPPSPALQPRPACAAAPSPAPPPKLARKSAASDSGGEDRGWPASAPASGSVVGVSGHGGGSGACGKSRFRSFSNPFLLSSWPRRPKRRGGRGALRGRRSEARPSARSAP